MIQSHGPRKSRLAFISGRLPTPVSYCLFTLTLALCLLLLCAQFRSVTQLSTRMCFSVSNLAFVRRPSLSKC